MDQELTGSIEAKAQVGYESRRLTLLVGTIESIHEQLSTPPSTAA